MNTSVREKISAAQHRIWSSWMKYLFSICPLTGDGSVIIPPDKVKRWKRQIATRYEDLTEREKDSDRDQTDKVLSSVSILESLDALIS